VAAVTLTWLLGAQPLPQPLVAVDRPVGVPRTLAQFAVCCPVAGGVWSAAG
jgi:hypothetical protein